jgi:hypothetical protein
MITLWIRENEAMILLAFAHSKQSKANKKFVESRRMRM